MLIILFAIGIGTLFWIAASASGRNSPLWATMGVVFFLVPVWLFNRFLLPDFVDVFAGRAASFERRAESAIGFSLLGILIGLGVSVIAGFAFLRKRDGVVVTPEKPVANHRLRIKTFDLIAILTCGLYAFGSFALVKVINPDMPLHRMLSLPQLWWWPAAYLFAALLILLAFRFARWLAMAVPIAHFGIRAPDFPHAIDFYSSRPVAGAMFVSLQISSIAIIALLLLSQRRAD